MWRAKFKVCWQICSERVMFGLGLSYCDLLYVFPHFSNLCTSHNATPPPSQKPVVPRPTQKWKSLPLQTAPDRFDSLTQEAQVTKDSPSLVMQHRLTQPYWLTSQRGVWQVRIQGKQPLITVQWLFFSVYIKLIMCCICFMRLALSESILNAYFWNQYKKRFYEM